MITTHRPAIRIRLRRRACAAALAVAAGVLPVTGVQGTPPPQDGRTALLERYSRAVREAPENAYYRYAAIQTAKRLDVEPPPEAFPSNRTERWRRQIYEMTTGAWAIQESLQLDRLAGTGDTVSPATVPIESVPGLATPSVPLDSLLAGRSPVVEPLAGAVPADVAYAHFPRVSSMRRVLDATDRWGGHLLSSYSLDGREERVRQTIENQLLLATTPELDPFYDLVTDGIAVVASDPFVAEGTDVTVVFRVRNQLLFGAKMDLGRRTAAAAASGRLTISQEQHRDWSIDGMASPDRAVSSFSSAKGDLAIVSTSAAALKRVADVADGLSPSMGAADDFRAMRASMPYSATAEDGFLFLSDAFVRRVVGPRLKIGEARRVRCAVSLQTAAFATLMFWTEQGRAPVSVEELTGSRYLERDALRCADGGTYSLDAGTPVCSVHNRIGRMTPNSELRLDRVSPDEVESYNRFREGYTNYWRRYVDPVGIRVRAGERLEVDARILPLVDNSIYSSMVRTLGNTPVSLATPQLASAIATIDVKLPPPSSTGGQDIFGINTSELLAKALGDHVSIQIADGSPPVSTDLSQLFEDTGFGRLDDWVLLTPAVAALTLPTAIVAPVRDPRALGEALAQFRENVSANAYRPDPWFHVENYRVVEGGARPVEAVTVRFFIFMWRIYYAVAGDRFILATDRSLIDELAEAGPSPAGEGALRLEIAPGRWKKIGATMAISYADESRRVCLTNLPWLNAFRAAFPVGMRDLDDRSVRLLGARFVCPDNGRYAVGPSGAVECTLHGTRYAPRQGPRPQVGSPAAFLLERVRRLSVTMAFEPDGLSTRLVIE